VPKNGASYSLNNMEEIDLTKIEKVGSIKMGCAAGEHVFDTSKTKLQITGGTTTLVSMKCLLCGANVEVDVNWEDEESPGNVGVNDLVQKYEEDADAQQSTSDIHDNTGDEFWKKLRGK